MKSLNTLFNFLLFPFLFIMRIWKNMSVKTALLLFLTMFATTSTYAVDAKEYSGGGYTSSSTGCDNSLDTSANNNNPGVTIADMNNITAHTTDCISGSSRSDDEDHYNFKVSVDGTINIVTSSPNNHKYYLKVNSNKQSTMYPTTEGKNRSLSYAVTAGEIIYLRTEETGRGTDWWQINLEFTPVANVAPTANAGEDSDRASVGEDIQLDGTGSTDSDGSIASYAWTVDTDPDGTWSSATPTVSGLAEGDHTFTLTVTDDDGATATDTVLIKINAAANIVPVADAGPNQEILANEDGTFELTLDGSGSNDEDGTITSYSWTDGRITWTGVNPILTEADLDEGEHTITLTVKDDDNATASDTVIITILSADNVPPVADAGEDQRYNVGDQIILDGNGSTDSDGNITDYSWTDGTTVWTGVNPDLTGLATGEYDINLTITDNGGLKSSDIVNIKVNAKDNEAPIAEAGPAQTVVLGVDVSLDGSESNDSDGNITAYSWSEDGTELATGVNPTVSDLTEGEHIITLTVTDDDGATATDTVIIDVVRGDNTAPVADAQNVALDKNGSLDIVLTGSDQENDPLTFIVVDEPMYGTLTGTAPNLTYTPNINFVGDDSFTFKVNDGYDDSEVVTVSISVIDPNPPIIYENADDLCYEDNTYAGRMCMDMGICKGGIGCTTAYPLKNINPEGQSLSNVSVFYEENGMGGTMAGDCSIRPSGDCNQESNIEMGPMGMLGSTTAFYFADDIDTDQDDASIATKALFAMSCLNSSNLYAYYTRDGNQYRGAVKSCDPEKIGDGADRPFTIRNPKHTRNITGNYAIIGNSNQCTLHSNDKHKPWTGECYASYSNDRPSKFLNIDSNDTTVNSTKSTLNIPSDATVVFAGLYWQGVVHNSNQNTDFMDDQTISGKPTFGSHMQLNFAEIGDTYGADEVQFKTPNGSYQTVRADRQGSGGNARGFDYYQLGYAGFKDVTSLIDINNPNGDYYVADIKSHQGIDEGSSGNHGNYAAWSLVVIYTKDDEKFRNITLFDGYATVNSHFDEDLVMEGFLTSKTLPINSKLAMFAMDGDNGENELKVVNEAGEVTEILNQENPENSLFDSTISSSIERSLTDPITSLRTDLKVLELEDVLNPLETKATLKPRSGGDRYTPSYFIMSAELIRPDLCYDYSYKQDGSYFTEENDGSKDPRLEGSLFSQNPITVSLYLKNRENSDFTITNMSVSVKDIDTLQASYIDSTTQVILNDENRRKDVTPRSSNESSITDIPIGPVGGDEDFYLYYNLDPKEYHIDMPINAYLNYTATFKMPDGTILELPPYSNQKVNSDIPLCVEGDFSYSPILGAFNVQHKNLNKYNLYTQVARRVDDFEVKSYDINNTDTAKTVSTIVAVELIDAGSYHETQTSCQEPERSLTPRVWVVLDNTDKTDFTDDVIANAINMGLVSDAILHEDVTIDSPEDFYDVARRNTAFRVSSTNVGTDSLIKLTPSTCRGNQHAPCYEVENFPDLVRLDVGAGAGNCGQDIDGNPNSTDKIPQYCGNAGRAGLDSTELAQCMECIYGYDLTYVCSRDNFAIRPKSIKISLSDDNNATDNVDFANNTDKARSQNSPVNLVVGYPYKFEINATNFKNENPVKGYIQKFDSSDKLKRAFMQWSPSSDRDVSDCNVPEDRNMTFFVLHGMNTNPSPLNTWQDSHDTLDNVGEYVFKIVDDEWTKFDWDINFTQHHNSAHFISSSTPDCIVNSTSSANAPAKAGCTTSSIDGDVYKPVYIQSYPFDINVNGLSATSKNGKFVYINTLDKSLYPNGIDENMSYNVQGSFSAMSYDHKRLTNFVNNCYAEDVDMLLDYSYTFDADENNTFAYDIMDNNGSSTVYRERENHELRTDNIITQGKEYFAKEMNGSITMDLGYNYPRTNNTPMNPISVKMNNFSIGYTTQPNTLYVEGLNNHKILGKKTIDKTVNFFYGRVKPAQEYYQTAEASMKTPISTVIYCNLGYQKCQDRGIMAKYAQTNEKNWWKSLDHDNQTNKDGNIEVASTPRSAISTTNISIMSKGENDSTVISRGDANPPLIVPVKLVAYDKENTYASVNYTDRWLIYNPTNATKAPSRFYRVKFTGQSGWAGHGKTGHVVGGSTNTNKNRRLEW